MKTTILAIIVVVIVIGAAASYVVLRSQPQPQPTPSPGDDYGFGSYLDGLDNYLNDFAGEENIDFSDIWGLPAL